MKLAVLLGSCFAVAGLALSQMTVAHAVWGAAVIVLLGLSLLAWVLFRYPAPAEKRETD